MAGRFENKRILVVEDEYFVAADLKRALAAEGAVVVGPAGRLEQGLALAAAGPVDAAVLDVNLAGTPSFPLADRLAADGVPCAFVTGYDGWSLPEDYREAPRLAKPFAMTQVLDLVDRLMAAAVQA